MIYFVNKDLIPRVVAYYNAFNVYRRELAPGTVSLTGDRAQGDDSKHWANSIRYVKISILTRVTRKKKSPFTCLSSPQHNCPHCMGYGPRLIDNLTSKDC